MKYWPFDIVKVLSPVNVLLSSKGCKPFVSHVDKLKVIPQSESEKGSVLLTGSCHAMQLVLLPMFLRPLPTPDKRSKPRSVG